ncbi:hypothetical protein KKB55_23425, partial [Myxococcota bacterium]|nr:hypothetical protein [Myxococcota bacterium]
MRTPLIIACALLISSAEAYERSWYHLTTGNGHGFQIFDSREGKIDEFLEHPYRFVAPPDNRRDGGIGRRDLAHDIYFGARAGGQTEWFNRLAAGYEQQSHIITARKSLNGVNFTVYYFSPFGYEGNAMVMLIRAQNGGSATNVSFFSKPNMLLGDANGDSRVERRDNGEQIEWKNTYGIETGPGGGHVIYMPIGGVDQIGCGGDSDLYNTILGGGDASGGPSCSGDGRVLVLQRDVSLGAGEEAWWGQAILFVNDNPREPQAEDFRDYRSVNDVVALWTAFAGEKGAGQIHDEALAEFEAWRKNTAPPNLSQTERTLWRQSETVLRMGQVREVVQANRRNHGMILAALPIGEWHTGWVRDMSYGVVALAMTGHVEEAKKGIEFYLGGEAGFFTGEIGRPYRVSSCRYYGNGKEEADFNFYGANVETDGWGLALWAARMAVNYSCDLDWLDRPTLYGDSVMEGLFEIAEDIRLQIEGALPAPECSIWEVHWDYRQVFTYTTAAQIRGMLDFADIALAYARNRPQQADHWNTVAEQYRGLGIEMLNAMKSRLVNRSDNSLVSHAGVASRDVYRDGSTAEALSWGLLLPDDPIYRGTLEQFTRLRTNFGGYRRLEPGLSLVGEAGANLYDLSEWILLDLRIGEAWRHLGESGRADELLNKVTETAMANDFLVPELFEPDRGHYTGVVPMVGYGAGAWMMAQLEKHGFGPPTVGNVMEICDGAAGGGGEGGGG